VQPNDADPFPSRPHAHVGAKRSPFKVNIDTGEIVNRTRSTGRNIGKKTLGKLRGRLRGLGLLGVALVIVLETPDTIDAAERGGIPGVVSHTGNVTTRAVIATGEAAITGGAIVGSAQLAGTSVTVSGAAVTGVSGATVVGGTAIAAGGVGYGIGYGIGRIHIGRSSIHQHLGNAMYAVWDWIVN